MDSLIRALDRRGPYRVIAYCLMPDHVHCLVDSGEGDMSLSAWVRNLKGLATKLIRPLAGKPPLWQRGFYDHIVRSDESIPALAEYVIHNPVRAGLVETAEAYPFGAILSWPG